jgi:hypothetical protein
MNTSRASVWISLARDCDSAGSGMSLLQAIPPSATERSNSSRMSYARTNAKRLQYKVKLRIAQRFGVLSDMLVSRNSRLVATNGSAGQARRRVPDEKIWQADEVGAITRELKLDGVWKPRLAVARGRRLVSYSVHGPARLSSDDGPCKSLK